MVTKIHNFSLRVAALPQVTLSSSEMIELSSYHRTLNQTTGEHIQPILTWNYGYVELLWTIDIAYSKKVVLTVYLNFS